MNIGSNIITIDEDYISKNGNYSCYGNWSLILNSTRIKARVKITYKQEYRTIVALSSIYVVGRKRILKEIAIAADTFLDVADSILDYYVEEATILNAPVVL